MKKATFTFYLLFLSASLMSQIAGPTQSKNNSSSNSAITISTVIDRQGVIWSDDFSAPSAWTINTPIGSGAMKDWVIGITVPSGAFPLPAINSTTKANGFALFDSDKNCSGNQLANLTTASPINCSSSPFVRLEFQQQYRKYSDSTFVFVSNDGTNWDKYPVNESLMDNDFSATNPEKIKINISATAGGEATVWIRFQFNSTPADFGAYAGCGYAWMIDDVSISDINANDLAIDQSFCDFGHTGGGYYTQIPNNQIVPITFRAKVSNQGSSGQTNALLNVKVSDGNTTVYNENSTTIPNLPYKGIDTLSILTPFTPSIIPATYTTTFKVNQTQTELNADTLNNIIVQSFKVTDTIYARDNGTRTGITGPNYFTGGEEDGSEIANLFEFAATAQSSSISVYLDATTDLATSIQANIYEIDTLSGLILLVASSGFYTINSAADIGKWVTLPVSTTLNARVPYLASVYTGGVTAGGPKVVIGADELTRQPVGTTFVYLSAGVPQPEWVYISDLPMIRLNIKASSIGIAETQRNGKIKLFQNQPNPFTKASMISYELTETAKVILNVYDITGKIIMTINEGNKDAGVYSINIDGKQFAPGTYFYSLRAGNASITKKMVIIE